MHNSCLHAHYVPQSHSVTVQVPQSHSVTIQAFTKQETRSLHTRNTREATARLLHYVSYVIFIKGYQHLQTMAKRWKYNSNLVITT